MVVGERSALVIAARVGQRHVGFRAHVRTLLFSAILLLAGGCTRYFRGTPIPNARDVARHLRSVDAPSLLRRGVPETYRMWFVGDDGTYIVAAELGVDPPEFRAYGVGMNRRTHPTAGDRGLLRVGATAEIRQLVREARFWEMDGYVAAGALAIHDESCVIEARAAGRHHVVQRDVSGAEPEFWSLCEYMMELASRLRSPHRTQKRARSAL